MPLRCSEFLRTHQKMCELLIGFLVAAILVSIYSTRKIDNENLALGNQNVSALEEWQGKTFTGYSPPTIRKLAENINAQDGASHWLWLGNSQLHAINQRKDGDHLAPYWLRRELACSDCVIPMGVSIPNASFQEFLLLSQYMQGEIKIDFLILELPFISLREIGIRSELVDFIDPVLRTDLLTTPAGSEIVQEIKRDQKRSAKGNEIGGPESQKELEHDFQKRAEDILENQIGAAWPAWKDRGLLKAYFLIDLYYVRNWLLNIKPTTVRKQIPERYDRNMRALEDILRRSKQKGVHVLVYIAPIRQDLPLPYVMAEYDEWKMTVERMVHKYGGQFLNFEAIVPAQYWGTYHNDEVDFMHFQGAGHQLIGKEIARHLNN